MPDPKSRLIEAAVAPISHNAELDLAGRQLLQDLVPESPTGVEWAISRWEGMGRKRWWQSWKLVLFIITLICVIGALTSIIPSISTYRSIYTMGTLASFSPTPPKKSERPNLTDEEKLILYGDESKDTKAEQTRALWDRYPDNPAYFAKYVEAHLSETGALPADFLAHARRIDPTNAWFIYVAAGVEAKDSVEKKRQSYKAHAAKEPIEWEILDQEKFERALALLREARDLPISTDYKDELWRLHIPLLAQETHAQWLNSIYYMAFSTNSDVFAVRRLSDVISARAALLATSKDVQEFEELMEDSDQMVQKTLNYKGNLLVVALFHRSNVSAISHGLASAAQELGIQDKAEHYQRIYDRIREVRDLYRTGPLAIDETEFRRKSSLIRGISIPLVAALVPEPPQITDDDLLPGRHMDHENASTVSAIAVFLLLGICLALVWASRFWRGKLFRRLNACAEALLTPRDWAWIIGIGIGLPLIFIMGINRFTPLGGRDISIYGLKLALPCGHFLALFMFWLIMPILITRWRLTRSANCLGLYWSIPWVGWIAILFVAAFSIGIGIVAPEASSLEDYQIVAAILSVPVMWLVTTAGRSLLGGRELALLSGTVGRVLVPVYGIGMLVSILLVFPFQAAEQYWFERDDFSKLDPNFPSMTRYEYLVTVQHLEETRQIVKDGGKPPEK